MTKLEAQIIDSLEELLTEALVATRAKEPWEDILMKVEAVYTRFQTLQHSRNRVSPHATLKVSRGSRKTTGGAK